MEAAIGAPGRPISFVLQKLHLPPPPLPPQSRLAPLSIGGGGGEGRIIQDSSRDVDRPSLSPCTPWLVPLLEDAHEKAVWGEGRCWGRGTPQRLSAQTLCSDSPSFTPRPATLSSVTPPKPPFPLLYNGDNNSIYNSKHVNCLPHARHCSRPPGYAREQTGQSSHSRARPAPAYSLPVALHPPFQACKDLADKRTQCCLQSVPPTKHLMVSTLCPRRLFSHSPRAGSQLPSWWGPWNAHGFPDWRTVGESHENAHSEEMHAMFIEPRGHFSVVGCHVLLLSVCSAQLLMR